MGRTSKVAGTVLLLGMGLIVSSVAFIKYQVASGILLTLLFGLSAYVLADEFDAEFLSPRSTAGFVLAVTAIAIVYSVRQMPNPGEIYTIGTLFTISEAYLETLVSSFLVIYVPGLAEVVHQLVARHGEGIGNYSVSRIAGPSIIAGVLAYAGRWVLEFDGVLMTDPMNPAVLTLVTISALIFTEMVHRGK